MLHYYNKPGLWFVRSDQPLLKMSRIVSEYGVKMGLPMSIYTEAIETIKQEVAKRNSQEDCEYFWACNASDCSWEKYVNLPSCSFDVILVDGFSYLCHDEETDIEIMLPLIDQEARNLDKTVVVFVSYGIPVLKGTVLYFV